MTEDRLDELTRGATVRLGPDDKTDTLWGSGFFVAPGWVLSCAHVLCLGSDAERIGTFRVRGEHGDARACLGYRLGWGTEPERDLVLVRLLDEVPHPCVRLSDRYDLPHNITVYGWRAPGGDTPRAWSGRSVANGPDGDYGVTLAPNLLIPHGASGGPVLDRDHGVVAGVVKARSKNMGGGLAISITALRGFGRAVPVDDEDGLGPDPYRALIRLHDRWHYRRHDARVTRRRSWVAAQQQLADTNIRKWSPLDGATACALLAELPPPDAPDTLRAVIEQVLDDEPHWPSAPSPRDWRDGHGWLYDRGERADIAFLHYLLLVAQWCAPEQPESVGRLENWLQERLEDLPGPDRGLLKARLAAASSRALPAAEPGTSRWARERTPPHATQEGNSPVVTVEVEPDAFRPADRFHWRIWAWPGGAETVRAWAEEDRAEGVSLEELPYRLSTPLNDAFGQLDSDGRHARLELALPVEHFDVDVDLWRSHLNARARGFRPHPAERPFGVHRQVVLRCLHRGGEPAAEAWQKRWRSVTEGGLEALPLTSPAYAKSTLEAAPAAAVPVLCRTATESTEALKEIISAGFGLALWTRGAQHTYGCGRGCVDLAQRTAKLLRRADRATALPEELRRLRERISEYDAEAEWAEPLALLYDDPHRPIPLCDAPLDSP
ncbi:trypsin-like peptidase domain-containing protein [Streptomyces sp. NPDC002088]|uniref:VMAP-C domain-containing protein n=1 Tax=Streptomyces sp. NPDC002088 TaxID=3154665 RepID=UPI003316B4FE